MSRKSSLKHQKGSYWFSRVSKSLTLENCNMQPLVTTTLKTHTELCTPKLPEPEPTADSLIVSIPLQKLPSQVAIVCSQTVRAEPCSLVISIPLAQYKDAPVDSLASPMRRVVSRVSSQGYFPSPRLGACGCLVWLLNLSFARWRWKRRAKHISSYRRSQLDPYCVG